MSKTKFCKCNHWEMVLQVMAWVKCGEKDRRDTSGLKRDRYSAGPDFPLPSQFKAQAWDLFSPYVPGHRDKEVYPSSHWVNHIILGTFFVPLNLPVSLLHSAWGKLTHSTHSVALRLIMQLRPRRKRMQETLIFPQNWYSTDRVCTIMLHLLPFSCYLPLADLAEAEVT